MKKIIFYTIIFLLFASSCITEVEFDNKLIEPKLVVNGFINPDSTIKVFVSNTRPIAGRQKRYKVIEDANIDIYEDGNFIESLTYFQNFDTIWGRDYTYDEVTGSYHQTKFVEDIDTASYYAGSFYPSIGKEYKIEVEKSGYETVYATATIPETIPIITVDTSVTVESSEYYDETKLHIALKFHDPEEKDNYYRLKVRIEEGYISYYMDQDGDPNTPDSIAIVNVYSHYTSYDVNSDDIVLVGEETADDLLFGTPYNRYNIFDDELIDGSEHDLSFYFYDGSWNSNTEYFTPEEGEFIKYTFYLESISKESFLYMQSYTNFSWIDGDLDMFVEPVQVYNNIENGAGIFGAYSSDDYTIMKGEYPRDDVIYQYSNPEYYYYW